MARLDADDPVIGATAAAAAAAAVAAAAADRVVGAVGE